MCGVVRCWLLLFVVECCRLVLLFVVAGINVVCWRRCCYLWFVADVCCLCRLEFAGGVVNWCCLLGLLSAGCCFSCGVNAI